MIEKSSVRSKQEGSPKRPVPEGLTQARAALKAAKKATPSPIELARICRCGHYWGDHTSPGGRCLRLDRRQTALFGVPRCTCHQFEDTAIAPEEP